MGSAFSSFFQTGWHHIIDIHAYDHLLFVMTLCAGFKLKEWRQILVIITAFTIGHSITLIISALKFIPDNAALIEILVPVTIIITSFSNILNHKKEGFLSNKNTKYLIALGFGLIHGLAFASNFKMMMFNSDIILPLFAFNLGIEIGQLVIVLFFMLILFLYTQFLRGDHQKWNLFISGAGFGIALTILLNAI